MYLVALKMLIGDKAKFLGLIFGIFLSSFLICQQMSIFLGVVTRSYRLITDTPAAQIWVMDPETENIDKFREMPDNRLDLVRGVSGVLNASPLAFNFLTMRLSNGLFHVAQAVAIDEKTLMGAPQHMISGDVEEIRRPGGVILDQHAIYDALVRDGQTLKIGDEFELVDSRAVIVGIAKLTLGFYPQPILYMGYDFFKQITPYKPKHLGFIIVEAKPGVDVKALAKKIAAETGLRALTTGDFKWQSIMYFLGTGILINFGITVFSGFLLGIAIVGNMFYMLVLDYLPYFAMIRALGAKSSVIAKMIYFQAFISGVIGYGIGVGTAAFTGELIIASAGSVAFVFPPTILLLSAIMVIFICFVTAYFGIKRVLREDPKMVM